MGGVIINSRKYPSKKIIIASDFDYHWWKLGFLEQFGLQGLISENEPTHRAGNRLDQVWTKLVRQSIETVWLDKKTSELKLATRRSITWRIRDPKLGSVKTFHYQKKIIDT